MQLFVVALFGSAIFNNGFFQLGFGGINVLSVFIVLGCFTYAGMHLYNKRKQAKYLPGKPNDILLWAFVMYGLVTVLGSYLGLNRQSSSSSLLYDNSYIPRQAYYLFFIPLIILAGRHVQTPRILNMLGRHYRILFFFVYFSYLFINKTVAIDVPCFFCLSTLLLMGRERGRVCDLLMLLLIVASPIDTGGEMTQVICRCLCIFLYFSNESYVFLKPFLLISIFVVLACYIAPFFPLDGFGFDSNTSWRLQYWKDELQQLIATHGVGVGYGTSYATQAFVGDAISGPFAATADYSISERVYVVGCHNSFVSIAFRLGVIGAGLLIAFIASCSKRKLPEHRCNYLIYCVISSIVIVCFNVGFESPMYFFLFAFSIAALNAMSTTSCSPAL